ncbi:MAG: methionine--tRNA ligase [Candidatus Nomurabacteria bacterium]|nr:methionine--tRNA ligase [Candidatus Nomurabacteria bacterium]
MKNQNSFYITTTLPYVNAPLHLGHATEIIRADVIARYKKLQGFDIFFNTGTDEHGQKIFESAEKAGKSTQEYVDYYADLYKKTLKKFDVLEDAHYIRTTDEHHIKAAQEFWKICNKNGFIYKKSYQAKYCIGCEEEKTESELVDGKCPEHNRVPETINEENYFFKFSAFEDKLLKMYEENPDFIIPNYRMNEMREFIKRGLHDFSISRLRVKMSWGIPVPDDEEHVMYVWFDALVNYISTLGWPNTDGNFKKYWIEGNPTQYCGKNNTRFQGLMWQAMLMAADVKNSHQIIVNGFILGEGGVKMSKTLGNTIDPLEIVEEYGTDALRYFVLREFSPFEDTAVSKDKLKEIYNANLANGIGNLVSRLMNMVTTYEVDINVLPDVAGDQYKDVNKHIESFELNKAMDDIWLCIATVNEFIQKAEPFKKIKIDKEATHKDLREMISMLKSIAEMLAPFLPETSEKILELIKENKKPEQPLFLRKD